MVGYEVCFLTVAGVPRGAAIRRRDILKSVVILGGTSLLPVPAPAQDTRITVRDRFWVYGQEPGAIDGKEYAPKGHSYITAVEAASYLSVPNLIFEFCWRHPELQAHAWQLTIPMRRLKQVVWAIIGCSGWCDDAYTDSVLQLAEKTPNITGVIMDDFFQKNPKDPSGFGSLTLAQLEQLQQRLKRSEKKLDLWVCAYSTDLNHPVQRDLALCDVISIWVWKADELGQLPTILAKFEETAPQARKVLGCYMYDYGASRPMSISAMKFQCELALEWIKAGRIDGIIFEGSNVCDFGFDSVEWSREWIGKVGDQELVVKG